MYMRLTDSNRVTYGIKLSDRIWEDSNGQLICRDAIIARTGSYKYLESEIRKGIGSNKKIVEVFRTDDEVFDPISMASFENKPFVNDHPSDDVTPETYKELSKGYMRDIRRGEGELSNCLLCDIVVTDAEVAEEIKSGTKRELSLGYDTVIVLRNGKYVMTKIRGNHLALVNDGRAGCATIRDSASNIKNNGGANMKNKISLFDEDIYEVEEISEDNSNGSEVAPVEESIVTETTDAEPTLKEVYDLLVELKELLTSRPAAAANTGLPVEDADVESVEGVLDGDGIEAVEEVAPEEVIGDEDGQLLDACKIPNKNQDSKTVYSQFAKISDTRTNNIKAEVQKSFQERYNNAAKKSY